MYIIEEFDGDEAYNVRGYTRSEDVAIRFCHKDQEKYSYIDVEWIILTEEESEMVIYKQYRVEYNYCTEMYKAELLRTLDTPEGSEIIENNPSLICIIMADSKDEALQVGIEDIKAYMEAI